MMNPTKQPAKDSPALELASHFWKCMGSNPANRSLAPTWMKQSRELLDTYDLTQDELRDFMTWATQDNTDPKPQFNSVEYLAASNDPMKTLVKYADGLLKVWRNRKRAASYTKVKSTKPLPLNMAEWMMLGPGVNQPLNGWDSARQKMDEIKIAWYGKGGENQADPMDTERLEQLFTRYQSGLGINTAGNND